LSSPTVPSQWQQIHLQFVESCIPIRGPKAHREKRRFKQHPILGTCEAPGAIAVLNFGTQGGSVLSVSETLREKKRAPASGEVGREEESRGRGGGF